MPIPNEYPIVTIPMVAPFDYPGRSFVNNLAHQDFFGF